jgi:hypothetical protein
MSAAPVSASACAASMLRHAWRSQLPTINYQLTTTNYRFPSP